jgi:A/G-specific adenine glycosylase
MGAQTPVTVAIRWFAAAQRDLPWRAQQCSPWGVLVSEFMLQQTQVDRVIPRWHAWLERWPNPADLAKSDLAEALVMWDRLGYPRRARWLWESAAIITRDFDGRVPANEMQLRTLPGVGAYTAAAVCAFAYRQRALALDTNVRRVIARHWAGVAGPSAHITVAERDLCERIWPSNDELAAAWTAAVMELGAVVCTARKPRCEECPIARTCAWRASGYPVSAEPTRRRQATYAGSDRQARGDVLRALRLRPHTDRELQAIIPTPERRERVIRSLIGDQLVTMSDGSYRLGT